MSKMSKAIVALGVVAGLGVAALPLSTYAAIPDGAYKTSTSAQVQVEVEGAISISSNLNTEATGDGIGANGIISLGSIMPGSITGEMDGDKTDGGLGIGTLDVTVESNSTASFDLYINTLGDTNNMVGTKPGAFIPAGKPDAGKSAWGYTYKLGSTGSFGDYQAVPNEPTKINNVGEDDKHMSTSKAEGAEAGVKATNTSQFKFQASASANQIADTYSATVVFTAVAQ